MNSKDLYNLMTKEGKFLNVMKFPDAPKLLAVDIQNKERNVSIYQKEAHQMAFRFKYGESYFLLKANGVNLELENAYGSNPDLSSDHYWFKKENLGGGEHYGLCTVGLPVKYVCLVTDTKVMLSHDRVDCVPVTLR